MGVSGLRRRQARRGLSAVALAALAGLGGCHQGAPSRALGDPDRGAVLVDAEACGSCHVIPGRAVGKGVAGPPLSGFASRTIIAGLLPNRPAELVLWLQRPQAVAPGNGMPDVGLTPQQARDIAAYLYTLR
jgi:cytochrome c1